MGSGSLKTSLLGAKGWSTSRRESTNGDEGGNWDIWEEKMGKSWKKLETKTWK
jgi:hypothetical protein